MQKMIDLDSTDVNWEYAAIHAQASKTGKSKGQRVCPCCLKQIQKQDIPFCQNVKQLDYLGFGLPLFYIFLKNWTYSFTSLIWGYNYNVQQCNKIFGQTTLSSHDNNGVNHTAPSSTHSIHRLHLANKYLHQSSGQDLHYECKNGLIKMARTEKFVSFKQNMMRTCSFIIHVLTLIYLKQKLRTMYNYFKERTTNISDYSIIMSLGERIAGLQGITKTFFNQQFDNPQMSNYIQQVVYLHRFNELTHLLDQKKKFFKEKAHLISQGKKLDQITRQSYKQQNYLLMQQHLKSLQEIQQKLKSVKTRIQQSCLNYQQMINKDQILVSSFIITFNKQSIKQQILKKFQKMDKKVYQKYFGNNNNLRMQEAPLPQEIIYQHIHSTDGERYVSYFIGFSVTIIFLTLITILFFFIVSKKAQIVGTYLEPHKGSKFQQYLGIFLAYFSLLGVIFINKFIFAPFLHFISHHQIHKTKASSEHSFAIKYCLSMFFTTALMTLAVEAIRFHNYFQHDYGVIEEETIMFFLTSFFVPFIWLVNPQQIVHVIRRKIYYGNVQYNQRQANELMEDCEYSIGKRYAQIIKIMWFTFLYCTLIPIGALLSLVGLGLYFWVDKYNLLRRSSLNHTISGNLSLRMTRLLDFTLFFRSLGELIFDLQIRQDISIYTIISLVISIIFPIIPWFNILPFIEGDKFNHSEKQYKEVKDKFMKTYLSSHPIYIANHLQKYTSQKNLTLSQKQFGSVEAARNTLISYANKKPLQRK